MICVAIMQQVSGHSHETVLAEWAKTATACYRPGIGSRAISLGGIKTSTLGGQAEERHPATTCHGGCIRQLLAREPPRLAKLVKYVPGKEGRPAGKEGQVHAQLRQVRTRDCGREESQEGENSPSGAGAIRSFLSQEHAVKRPLPGAHKISIVSTSYV